MNSVQSLIRVIVAEDDVRIAEIQQRFMEKIEGFDVVGLSHTLEQTQQMVEILEPDLLLLDIHFPDGSGLDCLKQMREQNQQTDVILITAARDIESLKSAMLGGIFDYIVKPLVFERIQDSLQRYQQYVQKMSSLREVDQKMIDILLPRGGASTSSVSNLENRLPKGIDELTLVKVRALFSNMNESLGASTVGDTLGVSRTTARRYLEYMVSSGELAVDVNYGGVGRPERHYCKVS
jgi:two-component system, CitB family, response regulator